MQFESFNTKPKSFYVLIALLVIGTIAASVWIMLPSYVPLTTAASAGDAALIKQLEEQGLDYRIESDGQMLVVADQLGKGKILQQNDVHGGFTMQGLELYDQADYSMTEHTQQVTLMRALQGELERTLAALDFVSYARVHLTFQEKKLFDKNTSPAKAAVTVFTEKALNTAQVEGVQTLVASSVEGMQKTAVTVLSADGRVLSRHNSDADNLADLQQQQQLEKDYQSKLTALVGLLFVPADYAISVSVHTNGVARKAVSQHYLTDKNGQGFVVHKKQNTQKSKPSEGNVSSALANQEQTEIKFAHGTKTEEVIEKSGEVLRLSVAILVKAAVSETEQQQLITAIEAAIGYQPQRGDQLSVQFIAPGKSAVPDTALSSPEIVTTPDAQASKPSDNTALLASGFGLFCLFGSLVWYTRQYRLSRAKKQLLLAELQQWLEPAGGQRV